VSVRVCESECECMSITVEQHSMCVRESVSVRAWVSVVVGMCVRAWAVGVRYVCSCVGCWCEVCVFVRGLLVLGMCVRAWAVGVRYVCSCVGCWC